MSSQYYPRREHNAVDSATEAAKHYQRAKRGVPRGGSSYSPPASPVYEYSRQRTWPANGSGGGSYEERGIPIRERNRERDYDREHDRREFGRDYDDEDDEDEEEDDDELEELDWQHSTSPRTPRTAGMASGSSIGGGSGSYGRHERDMAESPRYAHDVRTSPPLRYRETERERERRERERERERDREVRVRDRERDREEVERKRDREASRQRMREATQSYPRRLRSYLLPVLQNQQAMDHATDLFIKLDQDDRYLTQSAAVLLESLATVADSEQMAKAALAARKSKKNKNDDSEDFTTSTEESSVIETTAEEVSDDSDLDDSHTESEDDDDDDDENQFGVFSADGNDMPNFGGPGGSRRPSVINTSDGMGGPGMGSARRRSSAGHRSSFAEHSRKGSSGSVTGGSNAALMKWGGFRPYALSKHTANVTDKRKSFLALTQIISVTLLASLGIDPDAPASNSGRKGSKKNLRLSTKGLLAELLRVLKPKDYRAYFRASARVIMVPTAGGGFGGAGSGGGSITGGGGGAFGSSLGGGGGSLDKSMGRSGVPDELVLEAMERQLLGMAKFNPAAVASSSSSSSPAGPMMACLTYSSGKYGSITLYRLDMAAPGTSGAMAGFDAWPRRITPVSTMTGVPKELLRCTIDSMPMSRRTVMQIEPDTREGKGRNAKNRVRPRWRQLPSETALPCLGYSPSVDNAPLSTGLCDALLVQPEELEIQPGVMANIVNATLPAMVCWLHSRTAYLSNIEFETPEVQRAPSNSTRRDRERERERERDFDDNASTSTINSRGRVRRIVRWRRGPDVVEHEGREPTVVVLHPNRGEWVTTPVYWTNSKEVVAEEAARESIKGSREREREREKEKEKERERDSSGSSTSSRDSRDKDRESKRERRDGKDDK